MTKFSPRGLRAIVAGAALATAPMTAHAEQFINILTGGTSGVYYPIGVGLSKIFADGIEGARTQVQATKASVENLNLLQQGKGEFAIALGDSVKYAAEGNADVGFATPLDKIRGISAAYPNYIQVAASKDFWHRDDCRFQGEGDLGRGGEIRHRAERPHHPWGPGDEL